MNKKCCGMSITLNRKNQINNLLLDGLEICGSRFYILTAFVFLLSFGSELLKDTFVVCFQNNRKKIRYSDVILCSLDFLFFFISWCLMTVTMTANIYIISSIGLGKVLYKIFSMHFNIQNRNRNECCMV